MEANFSSDAVISNLQRSQQVRNRDDATVAMGDNRCAVSRPLLETALISSVLSQQSLSIWGKSDRADNAEWLPLYVHMSDSKESAERLWDMWVPEGIKSCIARSFNSDIGLAKRAALFLAAVHDVGKATPVFQIKSWGGTSLGDEGHSLWWKPESAGLRMQPGVERSRKPAHPIAGQKILEDYMEGVGLCESLTQSFSTVVGGHHGALPKRIEVDSVESLAAEMGYAGSGKSWKEAQRDLVKFAEVVSGFRLEELGIAGIDYVTPQCEALLTGVVIMADWIASNTTYFPLIPLLGHVDSYTEMAEGSSAFDYPILRVKTFRDLSIRATEAWKRVDITPAWQSLEPPIKTEDLFTQRFHLPQNVLPRPVQTSAIEIAHQIADPGIVVIEAPMGEGKTEAALAAAEILAQKTGRGGVCVALPTMATTDAMFDRVADWVDSLPQPVGANEKSIYLAHGKAALNERFQGIVQASHRSQGSDFILDDETKVDSTTFGEDVPEAIAADWFWGRKRGVLANFLVCTVDQVLMSALQMRHGVLRQLAIANKVVIIDECHAYDIYMQQYLFRTLEWLGGMGAPVILLSATMPESLRDQMVSSYLDGKRAKPVAPQPSSSPLAQLLGGGSGRRMRKDHKLADSQIAAVAEPLDTAYPLITYSDGAEISRKPTEASSRSTVVQCSFIPDDMDSLLSLVNSLISSGGCIGIICDVVARAQMVAEVMEEKFGKDAVRLTHSRFIDIDRMANETELRSLLGPPNTRSGAHRPEKLIVVGTQVLEQSLDIDFDVLVMDVAPIDLMLQRMGRLHRHQRGEGEADRPLKLQSAHCYVRGIEEWKAGGPTFAKGVDYVYYPASLMEALTVLGMETADSYREVRLPSDIAPLVRAAYAPSVSLRVRTSWKESYSNECVQRDSKQEDKNSRAKVFLIQSLKSMTQLRHYLGQDDLASLGNLSDEKGQRAVRDTEDTIEVLLLQKRGHGLAVLPWLVSDLDDDGEVPVDVPPTNDIAKLVAQCTVRLPAWMGRGRFGDDLVDYLEKLSEPFATQWQKVSWLSGRLILPLNDNLSALVNGWELHYSREKGLSVSKVDAPKP